jgi:Kef-type K+ transport system membrane component KefB
MDSVATILITLGALLLVGLATEALGRRTQIPRVSLLVVFGVVVGPAALGLLPDLGPGWFPTVTNMALVMIGFLLGEQLSLGALRRHGRAVLAVSLAVVLATAALVGAGLIALGAPLPVALLLAAIATSTAPAATLDLVHEGRARGPFTETLLGIVAVDDAWGLLFFGLVFAGVQTMASGNSEGVLLARAAWDLGGAALLGVALGVPMAYLSGRLRPGEPMLVEALGMVFLCGGLAIRLEVSLLLAAMVMGAVVANLARHHTRPFHAIEGIEWPFMIVFFVGSGASFELIDARAVGWLGAAFVVLRAVGRLAGAGLGGLAVGDAPLVGRWMGLALMPQAGVALGMVLVAAQRFPELAGTLLPVVIGSTLLFEIAGPVCTRVALVRAGELRESEAP